MDIHQDRVAQPRLRRRRTTVDVTGLARDVVGTPRELEPERPFELITNGDAIVDGDPDQLRQVLTNLIGNVRTHTPQPRG